MFYIGTHLSSASGFNKLGKDALKIKSNTFQCFIRNPRGMKAKEFNKEDIEKLRIIMIQNNFGPVIVHAPYTLNACSTNPHVRELAIQIISEDLRFMENIPGNYYNLHPGSGLSQDKETAMLKTTEILNKIITKGQKTTVLLETMSGKGSEIGSNFEEIRFMLDNIQIKEKTGVCFDACHLFDSGYDLKNRSEEIFEDFDRIVGIEKLKAFHINDSKNICGSNKDRHAKIGEGKMGIETTINIINHPKLRNLPFILETPTDIDGHAKEIEMLKQKYQG